MTDDPNAKPPTEEPNPSGDALGTAANALGMPPAAPEPATLSFSGASTDPTPFRYGAPLSEIAQPTLTTDQMQAMVDTAVARRDGDDNDMRTMRELAQTWIDGAPHQKPLGEMLKRVCERAAAAGIARVSDPDNLIGTLYGTPG